MSDRGRRDELKKTEPNYKVNVRNCFLMGPGR